MNDVSVLYAGKQKYSEGVGFTRHSHRHWEIFCVLSGKRQFELGDQSMLIAENQWVLVKPDVPHAIPAARSVLDVYILKFEVPNDLLHQMLMALLGDICEFDKMILSTVKKMVTEERTAAQYSSYISNALMEYLLYEFIRRVNQNFTEQIVSVAPTHLSNEFQNGVVDMIVRYIKLNYQHNISIKGIAEAIGYSESYCCTVFKNITAHTIMDYLNIQRIYCAEELIVQNTELTLSEVAEQVGYKNFSHFSKVFKQILHVTPSRVREMAKKDIYEDYKRIGYSPWLYGEQEKEK